MNVGSLMVTQALVSLQANSVGVNEVNPWRFGQNLWLAVSHTFSNALNIVGVLFVQSARTKFYGLLRATRLLLAGRRQSHVVRGR